MQTSALVILSGGQDSTTCLFWSMERFKDVVALSFDYGQKHGSELTQAHKICEAAGIEHHIFSLPLLNELTANSLTRAEIDVVETVRSDEAAVTGEELPNSFVEGRNLLFISYAAIFAKERSIRNIIIGVSETDYSGYPDCRADFISSLQQTLRLGMEYDFVLNTPLMELTKAEVWQLADQLGILDLIINETVTCYNGLIGSGCGECIACKLRAQGYSEYQNLKKR